ncbi:MAG: hypothetical protein MHPSP_003211, partial [Paramarteilia canceri]
KIKKALNCNDSDEIDLPFNLVQSSDNPLSNTQTILELCLFARSLPPLDTDAGLNNGSIQGQMLLPPKTRSSPRYTLVLDLDETLVHCSVLRPGTEVPNQKSEHHFDFPVEFEGVHHRVVGFCRPFLKKFLARVSSKFELVLFTASVPAYAAQLLQQLDPNRLIFKHRLFRDSCHFVNGNYVKDLSCLGRDLSTTIIVDNTPQAFSYHLDNGIPIKSWYDDSNDMELLKLLPFLDTLSQCADVRPEIKYKYGATALLDRFK